MKKNFKKLFLILAVVITALVCFAFSASALDETGMCGNNVSYTYNSITGELIISGNGDMYMYTYTSPFYESDIKSVVIKDGVTSIEDGTFRLCSELISVYIPKSVSHIGDSVFVGCTNLRNISVDVNNKYYSCDSSGVLYDKNKTVLMQYPIGHPKESYSIPNSVINIANNAFRYSRNLIEVTIPSSVINIGHSAFSDCYNLNNIEIPDSVENLGNYAFFDCVNLSSVILSNGITQINNSLFSGCTSLTNITIPKSVINIGSGAFRDCSNLTSIEIPDSIISIDDSTFKGCKSLASINIPDSVTIIGDSAFSYCKSFTNITIPDSVISIGSYAFSSCSSLSSIKIGKSVISIGENAFYRCNNIKDVYASSLEEWLKIVFDNDTANPLNNGAALYFNDNLLSKITIPSGISMISQFVFSGCKNIVEIIMSDSVTEIGCYAFYDCVGLTNITISSSVTSIGEYAFYFCDSLTNITIPDSVTSIGEYAFYRCGNLTGITISKNMTSIGESAFDGCSSLKTVYFTGSEEQWNNINIFSGNDELLKANIIFLNGEQITDGDITKCDHENKIAYSYQNATCEDVGYTEGEYCPDCEIWLLEREEIPATDHNYILEDSKEPTCSESGYKTYVCVNDANHGYTEITDMLPHSEVSYNGKKPTCTDSGWSAYIICSICGYSSYKELEATGHTEVIQPAVAATCVKKGLTKGKYCSTCNEVLVAQKIVDFTDHSFTKFCSDNNATFTADGTKTAKCDYCVKTKTVADIGSMLRLGKTEKINATQNTSEIKLTWNPAKNATGYRIYYKIPGEANWNKCVSYTTAKSHTFKNLPSGKVYSFAIRSVGRQADGTVVYGPYNTIITATKPLKPVKIISSQNTSAIKLTWSASKGADGYRIYYKSGGKWKTAVSSTAVTSHTFKNLKAGAKFTFAIRPYIKTDSGVVWGEYAQFTAATVPSNPTLKVTAPSKGKLTVNWKAVNGAESYQLWYKTGNGSYKLYKTYSKAGTLNFSNLKSGTKYTFAVRAVIKTDGGNVRSGYKAVSATVK